MVFMHMYIEYIHEHTHISHTHTHTHTHKHTHTDARRGKYDNVSNVLSDECDRRTCLAYGKPTYFESLLEV